MRENVKFRNLRKKYSLLNNNNQTEIIMFESLLRTEDSAISILKKDHDKVKDLFEKFEDAEGLREKKRIVGEAITELKLHAAVEEGIFYPAVREAVGKKLMTEADEEHHVAKVLIAELEQMDGSEEHYDAKFRVLAENIRHHIKEEERHMFPEAETASVDLDMDALGAEMQSRKKELKKSGVAEFLEEKMVKNAKGKTDSPAAEALKKKSA